MTAKKSQIKQANDGTFFFRLTVGSHPKTGKQVQKYQSGFKTRKEAESAYAALLVQKGSLESVEPRQKIPFKSYIEDIFLPWYKTQVKLQTYESRLNMVQNHFPYFYGKSLDKIKPLHIQRWQTQLCEQYKNSFVRMVQGSLYKAFKKAQLLGLIQENPAEHIGNVKKEKAKIDFWTKDEFEQVIATINTDEYYQYFIYASLTFLFMTGMRIGEATALNWNDIDFELGTVQINKNLIYKNRENYYLSDPKTSASNRTIALDQHTLAVLKQWQSLQSQATHTDFVLSYNQFPTTKGTIAKSISRYAKMANIHRITVHALRHSHASLLISMNVSPNLIKERLGHEDIKTTLGTYGHLYPNSDFEVAKQLNGILNIKFSLQNQPVLTKNQFTGHGRY